MTEPDKKPKFKIFVLGSGNTEGWYYKVADLLAIMEMRHKRLHLLSLFRSGEEPFPVPSFLDSSIANGEEITPKQYKKLMKRYRREWNIYLSKTRVDEPEFTLRDLYWRRN